MDYRMPLYVQLQDIIIKKIEEKKYLPGEAIPSERRMADTYGVNRMTVKRAVTNWWSRAICIENREQVHLYLQETKRK